LKVRAFQRDLERLYGLDPFDPVDHYFVNNEEVKEILSPKEPPKPQVLFHEEEGQISLSVHVGDQVIERIERVGLENASLSDFCSAAEEISHFVYLVWNIQNGQRVSLLDLELQGEIDKYLLARAYFSEDEHVFERIFEKFEYHPELEEEARQRYVEANRLGGKLCRTLSESLSEGELDRETVAWLREFYRLASSARLSVAKNL